MLKHERNVHNLVRAPFKQFQFDAPIALDFKVGALSTSTLLKLLNAGNCVGAANEFPKWNQARDKAGNLVEVADPTRQREPEQHPLLMGQFKTSAREATYVASSPPSYGCWRSVPGSAS